MLSGGMDALYRSVLGAGHQHYVRVEVWSGNGVQLEDDLIFESGQVTATLQSRVSRTLNLSVHPSLYPVLTTDLLAPFGNEIRAWRGVRLGDGSPQYTWQVFRGRITSVETASDGRCRVYATDRAADVVDNAFVTPQNSQTINTVSAEMIRLIADALPDATFGTSDTFNMPVRPLSWQFDRGSALDELGNSVGAYWYPLADGNFVIRSIPWTTKGALLFDYTDQQGGTVNGWTAQRTREQIFNVITVTGERLNGDSPVFATAQDLNPASATFVNGNFGVRSQLQRLVTPSAQAGAQAAAEARLQDAIAPVENWTLEVVPDAALELGDAGTVRVDGRNVVQVVSSFMIPLDLSGNMHVQTRSQVTGALEVV